MKMIAIGVLALGAALLAGFALTRSVPLLVVGLVVDFAGTALIVLASRVPR